MDQGFVHGMRGKGCGPPVWVLAVDPLSSTEGYFENQSIG